MLSSFAMAIEVELQYFRLLTHVFGISTYLLVILVPAMTHHALLNGCVCVFFFAATASCVG